jgi:hypothetical protein
LFVPSRKVIVMSEQSNGQHSTETQSWKRKLLICLFGATAMTAMYLFGFPWIREMLNRVYAAEVHVDKHVAVAAPRAPGPAFPVIVENESRESEFLPLAIGG